MNRIRDIEDGNCEDEDGDGAGIWILSGTYKRKNYL